MSGIKIFALDNQGESVRESLRDLLSAGALGGLLAIVVLYLFLRQVTTTLIVTASVPFSLMITLGAMYFAGLSLNILSMMGLMLAVGMLVDNACRYHRKYISSSNRESRISRLKRQSVVSKEVGLAVIAGTATTIIVFAPMIVGTKTDISIFLAHVAVTIIVALIASLLIAQTLVPMLAARIAVPPQPKAGAWMSRLTVRYAAGLRSGYSAIDGGRRWAYVLVCLIGVSAAHTESRQVRHVSAGRRATIVHALPR